jgi:hypothetical protein
MKKTPANQKAPKHSEPECLELLGEFIKHFRIFLNAIVCSVKRMPGWELRPTSPTARIAGLQSESKPLNPPLKKKRLPSAPKRTLSTRRAL